MFRGRAARTQQTHTMHVPTPSGATALRGALMQWQARANAAASSTETRSARTPDGGEGGGCRERPPPCTHKDALQEARRSCSCSPLPALAHCPGRLKGGEEVWSDRRSPGPIGARPGLEGARSVSANPRLPPRVSACNTTLPACPCSS